MTLESQRSDLGGHRGFGIIRQEVELIEDAPTEEFQQPYTVIMPRPMNEVRLRRQFVKGRCTVYDPEIAREFQNTYHYAVEPELPTPEPREKKQAARRYIKST